jgi:hypothetical protein
MAWQVYRNLELEKIKTRFYLPMSQNLKIKIKKGWLTVFFKLNIMSKFWRIRQFRRA